MINDKAGIPLVRFPGFIIYPQNRKGKRFLLYSPAAVGTPPSTTRLSS